MNKINFSQEFNALLNLCPGIAMQLHSELIKPEHLMLALLSQQDSPAFKALESVATESVAELQQRMLSMLTDEMPGEATDKVLVSDLTNRILRQIGRAHV